MLPFVLKSPFNSSYLVYSSYPAFFLTFVGARYQVGPCLLLFYSSCLLTRRSMQSLSYRYPALVYVFFIYL